MKYRPHIDGLRAVAVLAVVFFHAGLPGFGSGFVGVDIFFVISGYLITTMLYEEHERTGGIAVARFMLRRVRRLLPALGVVLFATLIAGCFILSPIGGELQNQARSVLATLALVANVFFWRTTADYFAQPAESQTLLHTWSLSVEEQFYLVWPWLLLAALSRARRRGAQPAHPVTWLLLAIFAGSAILCVLLTLRSPSAAFYLTPARAWEFAAGGAVGFALHRMPPRPVVAEGCAAAALIALLASVSVIPAGMPFPGWIAMWPVLATVLVIYACEAEPGGRVARLLSTRALVGVGLVSYSLYLWHWPILSLARIQSLGVLGPVAALGCCVAALLLAVLTYRFVEQPIRRGRWPRAATPARIWIGALALTATVGFAAVGAGLWAKYVWPGRPGNALLAQRLGEVRKPWQCGSGSALVVADPAEHACRLGPAGAPVGILVWGDSHAGQLRPLFEAFALASNVGVLLRFRDECPVADGPGFAGGNPRRDRDCAAFNVAVLEELPQLKRQGLSTVVIASRWTFYASTPDGAAAVAEEVADVLAAVHGVGLEALVVGPNVEFPFRPLQCLQRRAPDTCTVSRETVASQTGPVSEMLRGAGARWPAVRYLDPIPHFCAADRCAVSGPDGVRFVDEHHLSVLGAQRLLPALTRVLGTPPGLSRAVRRPAAGT